MKRIRMLKRDARLRRYWAKVNYYVQLGYNGNGLLKQLIADRPILEVRYPRPRWLP